MTQNERWMERLNEVMGFLEENHRNPSKYRIEEHESDELSIDYSWKILIYYSAI